jgi:inorganic pyrophosphatase
MNIWHNISSKRVTSNEFVSVIEIPKGSKIKQELDKETGMLKVDRILHTSMQYPTNYGFIPKTLSDDGDPVDVWVFCSESLTALSIIKCFAVGVIDMLDGGEGDEKIIAVPFNDPLYKNFDNINKFPSHTFEELLHFLKVYKQLEKKEISIKGLYGKEKAEEYIQKGINRYKNNFKNKQ